MLKNCAACGRKKRKSWGMREQSIGEVDLCAKCFKATLEAKVKRLNYDRTKHGKSLIRKRDLIELLILKKFKSKRQIFYMIRTRKLMK
jgi:hypothetical protein